MGVMLQVENLACGYGAEDVIRGVSFTLGDGDVMCLLGANGSGKTTLFKAILGFLPLRRGKICIQQQDIAKWSRQQMAQAIAYVPQAHVAPFAFSVRDVVLMARTAHLTYMSSPKAHDYEVADAALQSLHIEHLADKSYTEISGGERQLVLIARALAQESRILVMDEPASSLDFGNQIRVLTQVKQLAARGLTVLITTHSPNHAFQCASKVAVLKNGVLLAHGSPQAVLTGHCLAEAYGVPLRVVEVDGGNRVCIPAGEIDGGLC
jgi:iron complex transport system ATP-binding protein